MRVVTKVEVRLYAALRRYAPQLKLGEAMELNLKEGATVQQLYTMLNIPRDEVKRVIVNGIARDHSYALSDGDRIAIFPPVAGG